MMIETIRPTRVGEFNCGSGMTFRKRAPIRTTGGRDSQNASEAELTKNRTVNTVVIAKSPQTIHLVSGVLFRVSDVATVSVIAGLRGVSGK